MIDSEILTESVNKVRAAIKKVTSGEIYDKKGFVTGDGYKALQELEGLDLFWLCDPCIRLVRDKSPKKEICTQIPWGETENYTVCGYRLNDLIVLTEVLKDRDFTSLDLKAYNESYLSGYKKAYDEIEAQITQSIQGLFDEAKDKA